MRRKRRREAAATPKGRERCVSLAAAPGRRLAGHDKNRSVSGVFGNTSAGKLTVNENENQS